MKKRMAAGFLFWVLVSCSNAAQPAPTVVPTFGVLSTAIATKAVAISPSATLAESASPMPEPGDVLDPQGTPLQEWREIPILPEAVAGQESSADNSYSFRANVSPQEVGDFYEEELTELGWTQPFDHSFGVDGGNMTFRKVGSSLTITVVPAEGSVVVLLVLTLA